MKTKQATKWGRWALSGLLGVACAEDPEDGFDDGFGEAAGDDDAGADTDGDDWVDDDWDDGRDADGADGPLSDIKVKQVLVATGKTDNAELVDTLPVARSQDKAKRRVVLHMGPSQLPDLGPGDKLMTPAEVQVTTRCDVGQSAPGCNYNPNVRAQLILSNDGSDTDPAGGQSKPLSEVQQLTCTKNEHHCMFVFRPGQTKHRLVDGYDLPCLEDSSCHVNLVMWAWHPDARADGKDKVLVGGNDGNYLANGKVDQDSARLMAIRERGISSDDRFERETTGGGSKTINTNANPVLIYSHKVKASDLKKGEQFVVEAKVVVDVSSRARVSTKMFLTKNPSQADGGGLDKTSPTQISEHNGINCLPGDPCTIRKVAVFRVTDDISGDVYVNLFAKSAVPGGGSANVVAKRNQGFVRSVRYRAADKG